MLAKRPVLSQYNLAIACLTLVYPVIIMDIKYLYAGILGNLASALWFVPFATNILHKIRGVKIEKCLSIYFANNVLIDNRYPEKVHISADCVFAPFAVVLSHSFVPRGNTVVSSKEVIKTTYIGRGVFIGAHSVILPGTVLGDYCYVAAGSIVSGDFQANSLIAGNPAIIKRAVK